MYYSINRYHKYFPMSNIQSIHLQLYRTQSLLPLCASKYFGDPDLPKGYEYPSYIDDDGDAIDYQFICQINLADIAAIDTDGLLPHKGMLSFFAKIDRYLGYIYDKSSIGLILSQPDDVKVLYFPEVTAADDNGANNNFLTQRLVDDNNERVNPLEWNIKFSRTADLDRNTILGHGENMLLAEPDHREWEDWDEPCQGWHILLQIDSNESDDFVLNFVDWGVLVFLISPEDLANARFDRVRAQVLST